MSVFQAMDAVASNAVALGLTKLNALGVPPAAALPTLAAALPVALPATLPATLPVTLPTTLPTLPVSFHFGHSRHRIILI